VWIVAYHQPARLQRSGNSQQECGNRHLSKG
jgi:hypothetical protein